MQLEKSDNVKGKTREKMAERTGLEPATPGVTGRYSNQLNYRSASILTLGPEPETGWGDPVMHLKVVGGTGIEPVTLAL